MKQLCLLLCLAAPVFAIEPKEAAKPGVTLLTVTRVYVDRFGGGQTASQMRDMIMNSLQGLHLFQITENEDRADAILRGSGEDLVFTEEHNYSDNLSLHANASGSSSEAYSGSRNASGLGIGGGENETSHISDRKHEATAAIRLVNRDGDVIWAATKESLGGKFRGASADVADKLTRQLIQDVEKAKASASRQAGNPSR